MGARLFVPRDFVRLLAMVSAGWLSHVVPLRADAPLTRAMYRPMMLAAPRRVARSRERMRDLLGSSHPVGERAVLLRDHYRMRAESFWNRIRLRDGEEWSAQISLRGGEHLVRARERGLGAILWRMGFCDALIGHAACAEAGFPLTHLSQFHHGSATQTHLAVKRIAPLYCESEERLVQERVVIGPSLSLGFLRTLVSRLESNEIVSIMGENPARQTVAASLLGRTIRLAPGAPGLAWQTDAALLTLHAIWKGPFRYEVVVSEPIAIDRSRARRDWIRAAVAEYVRRLAQNVSDHPASWLGWSAERHPLWPAEPVAATEWPAEPVDGDRMDH